MRMILDIRKLVLRTKKKFLLTFTFPECTLSKGRTSETSASILALLIFEPMNRILIKES